VGLHSCLEWELGARSPSPCVPDLLENGGDRISWRTHGRAVSADIPSGTLNTILTTSKGLEESTVAGWKYTRDDTFDSAWFSPIEARWHGGPLLPTGSEAASTAE
jgi:hypothetical protein